MPKVLNNRQYRIADKLAELPLKKVKKVRKNPLLYIGITQGTFKKDISATIVSPRNIPVIRMAVYAAFFKCTIEDLLTDKVKDNIKKKSSRCALIK